MSALLDALLGPTRLADCVANDAALLFRKEPTMKHPIRVGRVFADMEATDDQGELYDFTIIRFGRETESRKQWFPNSNAANLEAASLSFGGAVVLVRPAMGAVL